MRYSKLDSIRGMNLISMMLYHMLWDIVYLFEVSLPWYQSNLAYIWQQSICWSFILLSGFCWSMGGSKLKRGMRVFVAGLAITLITSVLMPQQRVVFGVLTLLGSCMLLLIPLEKILSGISGFTGLILNTLLFLMTRNINDGYLGFERINLWKIPDEWYRNSLTTYLGFPTKEFQSTDYFSLFPWIFLFLIGYFLYRIAEEKEILSLFARSRFRITEKLGRKSLIVYILHQPLIYIGLNLIF